MGVTLTIRLIKSFEYRTTKNLVLKEVPLSIKVAELRKLIIERIQTESGFKPFRNVPFDELKLYVKAHGTKSQNLVINLDDGGYLEDGKTLEESGIENETEISFFVRKDYDAYKADPKIEW